MGTDCQGRGVGLDFQSVEEGLNLQHCRIAGGWWLDLQHCPIAEGDFQNGKGWGR